MYRKHSKNKKLNYKFWMGDELFGSYLVKAEFIGINFKRTTGNYNISNYS